MQQNFEKEFSESTAFLEQLAEFLRVPPLAGSCSPVTKFRFRLESRTGVSGKFRKEVLGYGTTSEIMTFRIRPRVTSCPLVFSRLENFMLDRKFEPILISFREMPNFFGKPLVLADGVFTTIKAFTVILLCVSRAILYARLCVSSRRYVERRIGFNIDLNQRVAYCRSF